MSEVPSSTSISKSAVMRPVVKLLWPWGAVILVMVLCHVLWSGALVSYIGHQHEHRVINVKNWKDGVAEWEEVVGSFARQALAQARSDNQKTVFFVGSSVSYGFPFRADLGFTRWVSRHLSDYRAFNLSVVGLGMDAITDFVTCSFREPYRPDVLIAEIPLVNSISSIRPNLTPSKRQCEHVAAIDEGLWGLVWRRPFGVGWVALLWEEVVQDDHGDKIKISPLPTDFFANRERFSEIEEQYKLVLNRYLTDLSKMGEKVFVFVSPIYTAGIEMAGGDRQSVEHQISLTYEICKSHQGVVCLDASVFNESTNSFANLTHLNARGNKKFGDWLASQVAERM
jgi:hypothetical protein